MIIGIIGALISLASFIASIVTLNIKNVSQTFRSVGMRRVVRRLSLKWFVMMLLFLFTAIVNVGFCIHNKNEFWAIIALLINAVFFFGLMIALGYFVDKYAEKDNPGIDALVSKGTELTSKYTMILDLILIVVGGGILVGRT